MPNQVFDLTKAWTGDNVFTAAADTDILIGNLGPTYRIFFTVTDSTAAPGIAYNHGNPIDPGRNEDLVLPAGKFLHLSANGLCTATVGTT